MKGDVLQLEFDFHETSPSTAVVETISEAIGIAATDMEPIYDQIDPEAIDRLFCAHPDRDTSIRLTFESNGYEVLVEGFGSITVRSKAYQSRNPSDSAKFVSE